MVSLPKAASSPLPFLSERPDPIYLPSRDLEGQISDYTDLMNKILRLLLENNCTTRPYQSLLPRSRDFLGASRQP